MSPGQSKTYLDYDGGLGIIVPTLGDQGEMEVLYEGETDKNEQLPTGLGLVGK